MGGRRWGRELTWEEREANAHLIAAAPDLYEALNRLAHYINGVCEDGDIDPTPKMMAEANKQAQLALAKARGQGAIYEALAEIDAQCFDPHYENNPVRPQDRGQEAARVILRAAIKHQEQG